MLSLVKAIFSCPPPGITLRNVTMYCPPPTMKWDLRPWLVRCQLEGRCSLSWVFKSFLKVERDAPALVVLGSSFHQRGTTNENSLDCHACTDGSAKRRSLDERSVLGVTFALTKLGFFKVLSLSLSLFFSLTHTHTHTHTHTNKQT